METSHLPATATGGIQYGRAGEGHPPARREDIDIGACAAPHPIRAQEGRGSRHRRPLPAPRVAKVLVFGDKAVSGSSLMRSGLGEMITGSRVLGESHGIWA